MTQALKFGVRLTTPCEVVGLAEAAGHLVVHLSDGTELAGRAIVVATGAHYRRLRIPRLEDFEGTGVYYAATEVESRLVGDAPVIVVGGGNSAGQAAVFLAESGSAVTLPHPRDRPRKVDVELSRRPHRRAFRHHRADRERVRGAAR